MATYNYSTGIMNVNKYCLVMNEVEQNIPKKSDRRGQFYLLSSSAYRYTLALNNTF